MDGEVGAGELALELELVAGCCAFMDPTEIEGYP